MAGAITRQNAPLDSTFPQQGQVDWVSLANHSVSFSVGVLSRLSKVGVDPVTVVMGRTLCRNMLLGPLGQKRVFEALSTLKSFSSYGKVIWFGFGVRHIVHELAGTEEGMTCVALSAALQVSYDSFFGAQVFRELSLHSGVPGNLRPTLHQWRALLHVSAGVLSTSKFPRLVDGFARILAPPGADSRITQVYATKPSALAQALRLLSDVATGRTAYCTFTGGVDCAWIAAVAEWLYCLSVEICSEDSSEIQYRSSADISSSARSARISIIKSREGSKPVLVLSKAFIVPSGGKLIAPGDPRSDNGSAFERRSEWSHLLTDIFGKAVHGLLQRPIGESFAYLLRHAIFEGNGRYRSPSGNVAPSNISSIGPDNETFLEFARNRLPELKSCLDRPTVQRDHRSWDGLEARKAIKVIAKACTQDPNLSPKDAFKILLLPGHIEHNEVRYAAVEDFRDHHDSEEQVWLSYITRPDDQIDFIVQETENSKVISGAYRIQSNSSHVRHLVSTNSLALPVGRIGTAIPLVQSRCPGNACADQWVINMRGRGSMEEDDKLSSWTLAPLPAGINGQEDAEEQHHLSQLPSLQQQRHSTFDDPRTVSWAVVTAQLSTNAVQENFPRQGFSGLEIHKFPVSTGGDGELNSSTRVNFAGLYARLALALRAFTSDPQCGRALLADCDGCAACIIKLATSYLMNTLWLDVFPKRDVTGVFVWDLADGAERSRTAFLFKRVMDGEARDLSSDTNGTISREIIDEEEENRDKTRKRDRVRKMNRVRKRSRVSKEDEERE